MDIGVAQPPGAAQPTERPLSAYELFTLILRPERGFYVLVLVYGSAISALTLSVPLSVQVLIGSVVNSALVNQVVVLALVLLGLLVLSGLLSAIQVYLMELFERRFFSRIVSEVTLRLIYARQSWMDSINRDELVNRYFDIMSVQKSLPPLLTGGLATFLQTVVGITLTSFYHPVFLLFNAAVVLSAWLVYRSFDRSAARSALSLSAAKYRAATWLECLARSNGFFKSRRTIDHALARTAEVRADYIREHQRHFRPTFAQILGFLALYAVTSASLLGIGGWLVIIGQLTIGQLVAAELVLAVIFYGLTRIGYYLELYYDLYAAMHKLLHLYAIPEEAARPRAEIGAWRPTVCFDAVHYALRGGEFRLDFTLEAGSRAFLLTRSSTQIKAIVDMLLNHARPQAGRVLLGGHDVDDFHIHRLRDEVQVVDALPLPECSIAEYLGIAAPGIGRGRMRALLDAVGLYTELPELALGLDQPLTPYGHPLSAAGLIKLRTAFALAADPRLLVLTPAFDMLSHEARAKIMKHLDARPDVTVICFSHRADLATFDTYLLCDFSAQQGYDDLARLFAAYEHASRGHAAQAAPAPRPGTGTETA